MLPHCAATLSWSHVLMLVLCLSAAEDWAKHERSPFHFGAFPTGFSRGAVSSAYRTEGSWDAGAKGMSNWKLFSYKKRKILHRDNWDLSYEGYCNVKEDPSLLKELKLNSYSTSLSWAQIIPPGRKADHVNEKGIKHFDAPFNLILENRITPVVNLYH